MSLNWKYKIDLHREKTGAKAVITEPLSISFDITRTTQVTPNQAIFTVYNLAENTRKAFEKMKPLDYKSSNEQQKGSYGMDDYCSVILSVQREGGNELVIFKGDMIECHSSISEGEWATEMNCGDGLFALKYASMSGHYAKDAFAKSTFEKEAKKYKLEVEFNAEPVKNPIPITIKEKFTKTLDWAFPNNWYIDNGTLVTGERKKIVYKITGRTLAQTPKREENILHIQTMFLPEPRLGNIMEVTSDVMGGFGQWEIASIKHKGEFPAGDLQSEFTLIPPGAKFNE